MSIKADLCGLTDTWMLSHELRIADHEAVDRWGMMDLGCSAKMHYIGPQKRRNDSMWCKFAPNSAKSYEIGTNVVQKCTTLQSMPV
jgi:hypothetical protein